MLNPTLTFIMAAAVAVPHQNGDVVKLDGRGDGLRPALRRVSPLECSVRRNAAVLFVHGSTFPSALSFGYAVGGRSWMDEIAAAGFDAWALDFIGYGEADRYRELRGSSEANPPIGRASEAVQQIAQAVEYIQRQTNGQPVSIVAHSWGTIPASMFVALYPDQVNRFVQYAPIGRRHGLKKPVTGAFSLVTIDDQWRSFQSGVPAGEQLPFDRGMFETWAAAYLHSDPASAQRTPRSVKVPNGPNADLADADSGNLAYDPASIRVPVLIARGEWDAVTSAADLEWLYASMTAAPVKRMVWINGATHRMHLERNRRQLYREVQTFLEGNDQ